MERISEMECDMKYKIYLNACELSDHTLRLYQLVTADDSVWDEEFLSKIQNNVESMKGWCDFGKSAEKAYDDLSVLFDKQVGIENGLLVLENAYQFFELIKQRMEQELYTCNVCGEQVFFWKFPQNLLKLRKYYGFRYPEAVFQLEHEKN